MHRPYSHRHTEVKAFVRVMMQSFLAMEQHLESIKALQKEDDICRKVVQCHS